MPDQAAPRVNAGSQKPIPQEVTLTTKPFTEYPLALSAVCQLDGTLHIMLSLEGAEAVKPVARSLNASDDGQWPFAQIPEVLPPMVSTLQDHYMRSQQAAAAAQKKRKKAKSKRPAAKPHKKAEESAAPAQAEPSAHTENAGISVTAQPPQPENPGQVTLFDGIEF